MRDHTTHFDDCGCSTKLHEAKVAILKAELHEAQADYERLTGLLRARFPANPDGSLPDWKVEDVLKEDERLRAEVERLRADNLSSLMRGRKLEREWWLSRIETCENGGDIADLIEAATLQIEQLPDPQSWEESEG